MTQHIGQRIEAYYQDLPAHERRVADFILAHFDDFAIYSAADLARLTGVSKATVTRLFKRLGFAHFQEVREHARELRNLGVPLVTEPGHTAQAFHRHFEREQTNVKAMLDGLDPETLAAIAQAVSAADNVVVMGFRNSYPVALHLRQQLLQVRGQVHVLPQPGQTLAEELASLGDRDVAVVVGFRRRVASFDRLMAHLHTLPCSVLLIADGTATSARQYADWSVMCPLDSISAFDSYAAAMSLVNILSSAVLHEHLKSGRQRMARLSHHFEQLDELS